MAHVCSGCGIQDHEAGVPTHAERVGRILYSLNLPYPTILHYALLYHIMFYHSLLYYIMSYSPRL